LGEAKLLKHKVTGKVRFLLRPKTRDPRDCYRCGRSG
jgi:hypothetical protein